MMEQHYAQQHYVKDLEALITEHQKKLLLADAEQAAAKQFKELLKAECDGLAGKLKEIDASEDFDEALEEERKKVADQLVLQFGKLKWFRDKVAEWQLQKEEIAGELHKLLMQWWHIPSVHNM